MNDTTASMASALPRPQAGTDLAPGTVQVSVFAPAAIESVWRAITMRDEAAKWFGDLSADLKPGGPVRLDFGDGDFFEIVDCVLDPPRRLSHRWRFLGTGPSNAITWTIEPRRAGCTVTVTDYEPNRSQAGVHELTEGWTDFLQRLQAYTATGRNSRYAWRREFDGAVELPTMPQTAVDVLFSAQGQRRWLPWSGDALADGANVAIGDGREPAKFRIDNVERGGPSRWQFELSCTQWRAPTLCKLAVETRPQGALLVVSHNGWDRISPAEAEQGAQRQRFGQLWIEALHRAQRAVSC